MVGAKVGAGDKDGWNDFDGLSVGVEVGVVVRV